MKIVELIYMSQLNCLILLYDISFLMVHNWRPSLMQKIVYE